MANKYLLPVYSYVYGETFSYTSFDKRLKMQKAIYLLQEMGVPVSDYGFSWYKHGPYSQALHDDAHTASVSGVQADLDALSSDNRRAMEELRDMLRVPNGSSYSTRDWCECLASLHYLRKNVLSRSSSGNTVLTALVKRKPHLNDAHANQLALERVQNVFS